MSRLKGIIVLILILILSGLVYYYVSYPSELEVSFEISPSEAQIYLNGAQAACPQSPCVLSMKEGVYLTSFTHAGYYDLQQELFISKDSRHFKFELSKIPELKVSPIVPSFGKESLSVNLPEAIQPSDAHSFSWNQAGGQLAYIRLATNQLEVWTPEKKEVITTLTTRDIRFKWSPNNQWLFGFKDSSIFLIDLLNKKKQKIELEIFPLYIKWSPDSRFIFLMDEQGEVYGFDRQLLQLSLVNLSFNLRSSAFYGDQLYYYEPSSDQNGFFLNKFSYANSLQEVVRGELVLSVEGWQPDLIGLEEEKLYLRDQATKTWYVLTK